MFGDFLLKKMLQTHGVGEDQATQIMRIVQQNPVLFQKIAAEIKAKVDAGQGQQEAAMAVLLAHQDELEKLKPN